MLVDGAGQLIVDVMTANRSYATIPSASAILDASNYTVQAISFGKDADGYKFHGHVIRTPSGADNGIIKVLSYQTNNVSSYHTSATETALEYYYKILPQSPTPMDTRLELKSTIPNYSSGVVDAGQYLNVGVHPSLSSFTHLIGGFPRPDSGLQYWIVSSEYNVTGSVICSGTLYSNFNYDKIMDASGFLTFASGDALRHQQYNYYVNDGALRLVQADFPRRVTYYTYIGYGDTGGMSLFGGLYQLGLWYIDLKTLLKEGKSPPYSFNYLNNVRKYKLFSKKTFNKNLLTVNDVGVSGGFNLAHSYLFTPNQPGLTINWEILFS